MPAISLIREGFDNSGSPVSTTPYDAHAVDPARSAKLFSAAVRYPITANAKRQSDTLLLGLPGTLTPRFSFAEPRGGSPVRDRSNRLGVSL